MSRSGYSDLDNWELIRWRGQVRSATRGKRGQKLLADLQAALESLPEKILIAEELIDADGDVCALGAVGKARGIDLVKIDPEDYETIAKTFDIAEPLAREIMHLNDEWEHSETPQQRYERIKTWCEKQLQKSGAR